MRTNYFTLLEIMIAIVLLAIAGSVIAIRTSHALEEKQFQTAVDRLYLELEACHHSALNMQADWGVILEKKNDSFSFYCTSPETNRSFSRLWKAPCQLQWNHQPIEKISILFASSGKIMPGGILEIIGTRKRVVWEFPQLFEIVEGSDGALPRPD